MPTVAALLAQHTQLAAASDSPRRDAELLLSQVLGQPRSWLYAWPQAEVGAQAQSRFEALLARRRDGEPMAYIAGSCGFLDFSVTVTPAVLVPRPETELLVEAALACVGPCDAVLDLGTGSGVIALAVARARPQARVTAVDASAAALAVAQANAERLGLRGIRFVHSDWLAALAGQRFDTVISNPPYVAAGDPHLPALRHEPQAALVAAEGGLAALRHIAAAARDHLHARGWLWLEHGAGQGAAVAAALTALGYGCVETRRDYGGHERITGGQAPC